MFARVIVPVALTASLVSPVAQSQRTILVTVLDPSGAAVKNVAPADLAVQEDQSTREVVTVTPATDPLAIAILVDNTKPTMGKNAPTQELRAALNTFVKTIQTASPESQIGIWEFAGAGVMTQKPTVKTDDLTKKINRMFPGQQPGGVMLEALVDASKELSKKGIGPRRVILSVSFNSPEVSEVDPREVALAMRKAGVSYWAISIGGNGDSSTQSGGGSASRELIMNNITQASGGMRLSGVTTISLEAQAKSVADALLSQYLVTYARPDGAAPNDIRAVSKKGHKALTSPWVQ
jgi:hypothetical protein